MGLDYRYLLFVERAAELDMLRHLAAISAQRGAEETTLEVPVAAELPYRTWTLPFRAWSDTPSHLWWDDPSPFWEFATVLAFEPDEALEFYQRDAPQLDDQGRHEVGYIYLTVHRGMADWASGVDRDVVLFDFGTTGSRMSAMLSDSDSVRRAMVRLLEECHGVCGIFDWEDHATLFWWRGRDLEVDLPTAELDLSEIERFVPAVVTSEEVVAVTPAEEAVQEVAEAPAEEAAQEVAEAPTEVVEQQIPDPSFWTPRNSTCDPLWRRLLDRVLMRFFY